MTGASDKQATDILKATKWDLEAASNYFYDNDIKPEGKVGKGSAVAAATLSSKLEADFAKYQGTACLLSFCGCFGIGANFCCAADPTAPGVINLDQLEAFAIAMGIDDFAADPVILYICYVMGCERQVCPFQPAHGLHMCDVWHLQLVITREEFVRGLGKLGVDSAAAVKGKLVRIRTDMMKPDNFDPFYRWAYKFNCEPGQKTLKLDIAIALMPILLPVDVYPMVPKWLEFLTRQTRPSLRTRGT
jgi:hypothetical protein